MNKKAAAGFISGIVGLIGGMVFIWLLVTLFSGGAIISSAGSKGIIMLLIFIVILFIITRKR